MPVDRDQDSHLAGLGFSFAPVQIRPTTSASGRPFSGDRQQPLGAKAVSFNLRRRRPGAAYSSPQPGPPLPDAAPPRPHSADGGRCPAYSPPGVAVDSAVQLLQSLKCRAGSAGAPEPPPARAAGLARLKEAALSRRKASAAEVPLPLQRPAEEVPGSQQEQHRTHTFSTDPVEAKADAEACLLLYQAEQLLAGCIAGAAGEPQRIVSPRHMQLVRIPTRAWEADAEEVWEAGGGGPVSPRSRILRPADVLGPSPSADPCEEPAAEHDCIAAHRLAEDGRAAAGSSSGEGEGLSIHRVHAILSTISYPTSPLATHQPLQAQLLEQVGAASAASSPAAQPNSTQDTTELDLGAAPGTLLEALGLLGLLSPEEDGVGVAELPPPPRAVYLAPLWLKLRAAEMVLGTKQETGWQEMRPLLGRLRHVRANLEFHKANAARGRSRTPPRQRGPAADQPWLAGSSSSGASKHKRARSSSPGRQLAPRPKVGPTSQESSELQAKLLSSLLPKLWLKLGLAALRHAAALARLRQRLLSHIKFTEASKLCVAVAGAWKAAAIPSAGMVAAAERFHRAAQQRQQARLLLAWQAWARHRRWQHAQIERGLRVYHRQLSLAALGHWRVYCQERHVERLQQALATRWLSAWSKRKAFTLWHLAARRAALQKQAMLGRIASGAHVGRSGMPGRSGGEAATPAPGPLVSQLPTLPQALAATHNAFQSVKDYVSAAGQELQQLREGLRLSRRWQALPEEDQQALQQRPPPGSPPPCSPGPVGSLQALLALLQPQPAGPQQESDTAALPAQLQLVSPGMGAPAAWGRGYSAPDYSSSGEPSPHSPRSPHRWSGIDVGSPAMMPGSSWQGSSPGRSPSYNPTRYASPTKLPSVHHPEAIQIEMEGHMAAVAHISQELEAFEKEAAALQQQQADLGQQQLAALQHAAACREESRAAEQGKQSTAQALQAAVDRHTKASTQCTSLEWQTHQRERQYQQSVGDEFEAKAAVNAAVEQQAMAAIAAQKWTKKVEGLARELSQCHRTQQPAVAAQLKEARQHLAQQQQQAAALQSSIAQLQHAAQQAADRAQQARQAMQASQAEMISAVEERQQLQQEIQGIMEAHERHAVEAVAKEQEAFSAEQQQRVLAQQHAEGAQRLQTIAAQVQVRGMDAQQLQQRVAELEQLQQRAAAMALAAARQKPKRSKPQQAAPTAVPSSPAQLPQRAGDASACHPPAAPGCLRSPIVPLPSCPSTQPAQPEAALLPAHESCARSQLAIMPPPCSQWSELISLTSSPHQTTLPPSRTIAELADAFYRACLLRHSFVALRHTAERAREQGLLADQHFAWRALSRSLPAWREQAAATRQWLAEAQPALRRRGLLRQWAAWVRERKRLRACEEQLHAAYCRRLRLGGLQGLRAHVDHQRWRDAVHEAVVRLRWRNMLRGWRRWARQQHVEEASLQRARAMYDRRLMLEAWRQWAWLARNKALLRRVFQAATELWQEEVGALLHTRNYQLLGEAFRMWQLHVLERQEHRRQLILWNAAAAFREKQLLVAGLQAFRGAVHAAHDLRRLLALRTEMFAEWRHLAASSPRHWDLVLAANQRRRWLLRATVVAWRAASAETAQQLARFWLRWQVRIPLHHAFVVWRAVARWQRQQEQQRALALALRRVMLLRRALGAWRGAGLLLHERRILRGMADAHRAKALARRALHAWCAAAAMGCRQSQGQPHPARGWEENSPASRARDAPPLQPCNSRQSRGEAASWAGGTAVPAAAHRAGSPKLAARRGTQLQQRAAQQLPPGTQTVVIVHHSTASHNRGPAVQPADGDIGGHLQVQAMLRSVEEWKGTAEYWRERLRASSQPSSPASAGGTAAAGARGGAGQQPASGGADIDPRTVQCLQALRSQWRPS